MTFDEKGEIDCASHLQPDVVADSVERSLPVLEIRGPIPGRFKPMIYKIDTCCFQAWCSALIG